MAGTAAAVASCSLLFDAPTVRVTEVRLASIGLAGGSVVVRVEVDNPNRFAIESEGFDYRLAFLDEARAEPAGEASPPDGERWLTLTEGSLAERIRVPAGGRTSVEVEVPFELASLRSAAGRLLRRGELDYRFTGEVRFRTALGGGRVPLDERGTFRP